MSVKVSPWNWRFELEAAYEIKTPCPACGGQLKRWRCRAFCMDCRELIHYMPPLEASGWKYMNDEERVEHK